MNFLWLTQCFIHFNDLLEKIQFGVTKGLTAVQHLKEYFFKPTVIPNIYHIPLNSNCEVTGAFSGENESHLSRESEMGQFA